MLHISRTWDREWETQDGGGAAVDDLPHLGLALFAERAVAHGEYLVQNQDVRLDQAGDGKRQAGLHAGGQLLEGPVLEALELRELDNAVIRLVHEFAAVAQHGAAEIGVLPHGQLAVEAAGQLQQGGHLAVAADAALRGLHNAGDGLQQGGFPRAVGADDTHHLPLVQGKCDVAVGPELVDVIAALELAHHVLLQADVLEIAGHVADRHMIYFQNTHIAPVTRSIKIWYCSFYRSGSPVPARWPRPPASAGGTTRWGWWPR